MTSLALEPLGTTIGTAGELGEASLVGEQVLSEAIHGLLIALAGPQPTKAAGVGVEGTFTWEEIQGHE